MAKKLSKRVAANRAKVELGKLYDVKEAIDLVKGCASAKFDESFDVAVQLGIDPKKSDQTVRGACVLPEGTGKVVRVAVFAQGARAEEAKAAGADIVGFDDLADKVKEGFMDFSGCDARCRPSRPGSRPAWSDAEPEGWHRDPERCRSR